MKRKDNMKKQEDNEPVSKAAKHFYGRATGSNTK